MTTFDDLRLSDSTLQAVKDVGYEKPSPIQEQAIPPMLEGRDVIGQAQTGSGKTAAFGLPIIEYVDPGLREVQALVLTPTRELCIQVTQAIRAYATRKGVDVVAVFGGAPIRSQQAQLKDGGHVVVGTVGRVLDLISRHSLVLHDCRFVVLDEADEMLDLGFLEDVEKILGLTPNSRQTALFSATMPPPIRGLADNYLYDPVHVKVVSDTLTVDTVEQFRLEVKQSDKAERLVELLAAEKPDQAIVFARTKIRVDQLYKKLRDGGMNVKALHGDMSQGSRDGVMLGFKGGRVPVLVATDVAARGLDISTVTHVVNFDVPISPDVYVHRIGRTGRVGRQGRAITFVEPKQRKELEAIERHVKTDLTPWTPGARTKASRDGASAAGTEAEVVQTAAMEPVELEVGMPAAEAPTPGKPRARPRRHTKPQLTRSADEPYVRLLAGVGAAAGVEVADLVSAVTRATGLDGEAVRDVRVLQRFALLSVPESEATRVVSDLEGVEVAGAQLRVALARS
ncbi:MAG: DEAD-box ATP-dependent RNA helicase DeaD (CshA) [uncultured Solirubrobacteraceae bacterium]|uniref:RNA helicase n=1 Tax=uncultured Solirubrobacteraceae bacterium TaxID=1162706 RepID=A0A6J4TES5_9ACTN|nr:MAG: DEAD-box ATP-dependent RNA helicase DeaD (CshA) [uncultured Solirubrobacteraceae bacterium]